MALGLSCSIFLGANQAPFVAGFDRIDVRNPDLWYTSEYAVKANLPRSRRQTADKFVSKPLTSVEVLRNAVCWTGGIVRSCWRVGRGGDLTTTGSAINIIGTFALPSAAACACCTFCYSVQIHKSCLSVWFCGMQAAFTRLEGRHEGDAVNECAAVRNRLMKLNIACQY